MKKGSAQKLSYVTDQAITSVKILQNEDNSIKINDETIEIKGICLWIILHRKNKIERLSDINSMILHMNLVEWKKLH